MMPLKKTSATVTKTTKTATKATKKETSQMALKQSVSTAAKKPTAKKAAEKKSAPKAEAHAPKLVTRATAKPVANLASKPTAKPAAKSASKIALKTASKPAPKKAPKRVVSKSTSLPPPAMSSRKRKIEEEPEVEEQRPAKKAAVEKPHVSLSEPPSTVLSVFLFGNGENCELGLGPKVTEILTPRVNTYLSGSGPTKFQVVQVACGGMHSVALTADNKIVTWGVNDNSALGRDTEWDGVYKDAESDSGDEDDAELNPRESIPAAIPVTNFPDKTRFVQVAAGDSCSFALTDDGYVYGWGTFRNGSGDNEFGYDASGKFIEKQLTPTRIPGLEKIVQVACGANHVLALDNKGYVWGWGAHEQNQLGRRLFGRHQQHLKPRRVEVCRGQAKYIASGEYHSFAIDTKDNVWAWGLNSFGEAGYAKEAGGDSAVLPFPMAIPSLSGRGVQLLAGGAHHSAAVTAAGECLVWGRMDGGQLGIGFTPEQLEDKDLIRYDERDKPRICLTPTAVPNIGDSVYVACGTDHTIFVNKEGAVFSTGFGTSGQLGIGSYRDIEVVRKVKQDHFKDTAITWAGAGGQFSIAAGPAEASEKA